MKKHFGKLLVLLIASIVGVTSYGFTHKEPSGFAATPASIYLSPTSASVQPGQTFSLSVKVKSSQTFNAAFVGVNYDSSALQFIGASSSGSGFPNNNSTPKSQPGYYYAERTKANSTGEFLFLTYSFKSLKAGTSNVSINTANSKVVNYPNNYVSFTANSTSVTSKSPTTPPTTTNPPGTTVPPSNPGPTPAPAPTSKPRSTPTQVQESPAGLSVENLNISEPTYSSVTITWTTSKNANSKVNFSTDQNDLSQEKKDDSQTTEHSVTLEKGDLKAGKHYYFRVTSDDGSGPATSDSEFDTRAIPVIIQVKNLKDEPVPDAEVTIGEQLQTTDENANASFELPEGEVTIKAQKGELSREVTVTIEVPQDDTSPQQITLTLGEKNFTTTSQNKTTQKKSSPWPWILLGVVLIGLLLAGFIFWRRRRTNTSDYASDPLEAENYTSLPTPIPSTTESAQPIEPAAATPWVPAEIKTTDPQYQPLQEAQVPHHTSLPEMVGRYGTTPDKPTDAASLPGEDLSPSGQTIPKHQSLKEMIELPDSTMKDDLPVTAYDLPVSPVGFEDMPPPPNPFETNSAQDSKPRSDGSLTIDHH